MNIIDIIVALIGVMTIWSGWRKGIVAQVCGLVGLVAAIWFAFRMGPAVGIWLKTDPDVSAIAGFAVVLVVALILFSLLGRTLRKFIRWVGLGIIDRCFGVMLSTAKTLIFLGIIFSTVDTFNRQYQFIDAKTLNASHTFYPIMALSEEVFPMVDWVKQRIPKDVAPKMNESLEELKTKIETAKAPAEA